MALSRIYRAGIVGLYGLVFWVLLPLALWEGARRLDGQFGWRGQPSWTGWAVVAAAGALLVASMLALWRHGRGLPISALPPPVLVRRGPYAHLRHPLYAGFNLALFGAGLAAGSPALAWVVAPLFLPAWLAYAWWEERVLSKRFGAAYARYRRQVGLLPRFPVSFVLRIAMLLRLFPARVEGRQNIPPAGGVILVANHSCYLDFIFVVHATRRVVRFLVTAEAFRTRLLRWLLKQNCSVPVRRYRPDPVACREMLRILADGQAVAVFPEGERAPLGKRQSALRQSARILARLPYPAIPIGISGAYDVGPRWAGVLRRRPVTIRVGSPIDWTGSDPAAVLDRTLAALIDRDPQPVHMAGLPAECLGLVVWRCPRCHEQSGWVPAELACHLCHTHWRPTADGLFADQTGLSQTLAELAGPVWSAPETIPLRMRAQGFRERSQYGPIRPLIPLGEDELEIAADRIRFGELVLPLDHIRACNIERSDTLQLSTRDAMWQFCPVRGSPFRLQRAVERLQCELGPGAGVRA